LWKNLHALSINISEEGWKSLEKLAKSIEVRVTTGKKEDRELFLFALETYLHILIRAIVLSKLGKAEKDVLNYVNSIKRMRNIFDESVFEWVYEAIKDQDMEEQLRRELIDGINILLEIIYNLNLGYISFDMFREIYQNILPRELRRSLGEFYTSEDLIKEVLEAIGLTNNSSAIQELYEDWKRRRNGRLILDPACGTGSFLVQVIRKIFNSFGGKVPPDIAKFVESIIIGVDINPFAVEMAKLNIIMTIADEMGKRGMTYSPEEIRVYWADSLARVSNKNEMFYNTLKVDIPALSQIIEDSVIEMPNIPILGARIIDIFKRSISEGKNFEDFVNKVLFFVEKTEMAKYKDFLIKDLARLYKKLDKIYRGCDGRTIRLIENTFIVQSLTGRCAFVVGNPPWVRIRRQAGHIRKFLGENYEWLKRGSSYDPEFKKTKVPFKEQFDYSVAFLERGLEFLEEGGMLGYVITSKIARSTYAGKMREDLVVEKMKGDKITGYTILEIRDYSLHPRLLFQDAVNYPMIISVKKQVPTGDHKVKIMVSNTAGEKKEFEIEQKKLPLDPNKPRSPWILAPELIAGILRRITKASVRLGDIYEVKMGVKTSADYLYIGKVMCSEVVGGDGTLLLELKDGSKQVEIGLLHPVVRGENLDPYYYSWEEFMIFPHDVETLEPLWNQDQRKILNVLGLLSSNVHIEPSGGTLKYIIKVAQIGKNCPQIASSMLQSILQRVEREGYRVTPTTPCSLHSCWEISKDKAKLLNVNVEITSGEKKIKERNICEITFVFHVTGLRIPDAPYATEHFTRNLEKLIKRDDYRNTMPPWAIFRVSKDKFEEYRIAWQEIATHIEAAHLPVKTRVKICGKEYEKLLIPPTTVYFVVENNSARALKLLMYLNSELAGNLIKLWGWSARGGFYRHNAYIMGHLPIPQSLFEIWSIADEELKEFGQENIRDLNGIAKKIIENNYENLIREIKEVLNISDSDYNEFMEYGRWLNEYAQQPATAAEEMEEEE
jgi:hypothetical protein